MPQMTVWRMRVACWIPKATNTHTDCVKHIAFPLQQWLHDRASLKRKLSVLLLFLMVQGLRDTLYYKHHRWTIYLNQKFFSSNFTLNVFSEQTT
jgi:hypothetical protein